MTYKIPAVVKALELKTRAVSIARDGKVTRETIGWFVTFERSHEALFVGHDKPTDLDPGTEVEIIISPQAPPARPR